MMNYMKMFHLYLYSIMAFFHIDILEIANFLHFFWGAVTQEINICCCCCCGVVFIRNVIGINHFKGCATETRRKSATDILQGFIEDGTYLVDIDRM